MFACACIATMSPCRQLSTGDQLRVFYENLSKDPNSLANLDQVTQAHTGLMADCVAFEAGGGGPAGVCDVRVCARSGEANLLAVACLESSCR